MRYRLRLAGDPEGDPGALLRGELRECGEKLEESLIGEDPTGEDEGEPIFREGKLASSQIACRKWRQLGSLPKRSARSIAVFG